MNKKIMRKANFCEEVNAVEWETKYGMSSLAEMKKKKEDLEEKQAGFEDDLSRREFDISGMCQVCQDKFFSGKDN
jgi:hypothetical protein